MRHVKGIVKKYSREYTRTLKDGKRKTYKTEQIQITIPKQDNIFEDKEDVLIFPYSEDILDYDTKITSLKEKYSQLEE